MTQLARFFACFLVLGLAAFAVSFPSEAEAASARPAMASDAPIRIRADDMTYDMDKNTVVFKGNVEAQREDFYLWAATLTLYLKPAKGAPQPGTQANTQEGNAGQAPAPGGAPALNATDLDRIVAEKNVRFRYHTQNGTAGKATYTVQSGLLVMEGDPVIRDGEDFIRGNVIRYYLNESRSEVVGAPGRQVEAVFGSGAPKGQQ